MKFSRITIYYFEQHGNTILSSSATSSWWGQWCQLCGNPAIFLLSQLDTVNWFLVDYSGSIILWRRYENNFIFNNFFSNASHGMLHFPNGENRTIIFIGDRFWSAQLVNTQNVSELLYFSSVQDVTSRFLPQETVQKMRPGILH